MLLTTLAILLNLALKVNKRKQKVELSLQVVVSNKHCLILVDIYSLFITLELSKFFFDVGMAKLAFII